MVRRSDSGLMPDAKPKPRHSKSSSSSSPSISPSTSLSLSNSLSHTASSLATLASSTVTAEATPHGRTRLSTLQLSVSVLFRLAVFIFLRWIPTGMASPAVSILYGAYVLLWLLQAWRSWSRYSTSPNGRSMNGVKHTSFSARQLWRPLVLGISSPRDEQGARSALALGAHTLLFLFFVDAFYSPYLFPSHLEHHLHFARTGAIDSTSATLHFRYPFPFGHEDPLSGIKTTLDDTVPWLGGTQGDHQPVDTLGLTTPLRVVYRESVSLPSLVEYSKDYTGAMRRNAGIKAWQRGPLLSISPKTDWVDTAMLSSLLPSTRYEYRLIWAHNNSFAPFPEMSRSFITWPNGNDPFLSSAASKGVPVSKRAREEARSMLAPWREGDAAPWDDPEHFSFASSSCVKPDFPWVPTQFWAWSWALRIIGIGSEQGGFALRNRIPGFDLFAKTNIDGLDRPRVRFMLQLGDLIYADVPRWGGPVLDAYRKLYRNLYDSESFRRVYERIPVIGIYDDHEVKNNWSGLQLLKTFSKRYDTERAEIVQDHVQIPSVVGHDAGDEAMPAQSTNNIEEVDVHVLAEAPAFEPAKKAWREYVGGANPKAAAEEENYYEFRYGSTAFFVWDTRKFRTPHELPDDASKTMLGSKQKQVFLDWIKSVNATSSFKFVISSVPFNTLWGGALDWDGKEDSWNAYRTEREELLEVLQYVPNVIVISGDRHEFASVGLKTATYPKDDYPVTEFSTSPLSMFYLPVRTFSQDHGLGPTGVEKVYKYLPDGNVKWTEFEVDTRDPAAPKVIATVKIDGKEAWRVVVVGKGVLTRPTYAIGDIAKSFLELLNFRPRRWFT
ncbi:hypothetical protein IE81DRAFT_322196 [Ceraceosorus guamensis]|uniref:PhoD-like phosphatase metallophosphatase domain-containing protein n=1 Tax=Ceraceosorus guamensis TaxID=1522189 RepID=A0A316W1W1_9BASI|nr:hypothetical protein IE81DRAFT_322196 [Ceraceosorus guamensis]PWN43770.1 hypothetical protein IE81DRAFT_322196 [Ceraceosorus guamensis]